MGAIPFDLQPVLEGELLMLRPLQASDFDDLFAVAADPLIWEQHPAPDRHKEQQFRAFFRESLESAGALIAIDRRDGRIIGSSRFHGYDRERSEIEIGWTFLARSHWGGRYNGEMEAAHASACVQIRGPCGLPRRPTESSLSAGRGENRRCARGSRIGCRWTSEHRLRDPGHSVTDGRDSRSDPQFPNEWAAKIIERVTLGDPVLTRSGKV